MASFWWVNQGVTSSLGGDLTILWAALKDARGVEKYHWDMLDQVRVGDVIIHYANKFVVGTSRVAETGHPAIRPASFEIDGRSGDMGRTVYLEGFRLLDIPVYRDEILLGTRKSTGPFTDQGMVRRGYLFPMSPELAAEVMSIAGLVVTNTATATDSYVGDQPGPDRELFLDMTSTVGVAVVKYRKEQGGLRSALFGASETFRCGICGRTYPVRYLRTAHVESRSECTEEERKDWRNVVMPACVFGCDALFEDGMLSVDAGGVIHLKAGHDETKALGAFANALSGRVAPAFKPSNRVYFEWRNAQPAGARPAQ